MTSHQRIGTFIGLTLSLGVLICPAMGDGVASLAPGAADAASATELNASIPADFVERTIPQAQGSFKTPPDWHEITVENTQFAVAGPHGGSMNFVEAAVGANESLEELLTELPQSLPHQFKGFKLLQADYIKLHGLPAVRLCYQTQPKPGLTIQICQFLLIKDGFEFVLSCSAKEESFPTMLPWFEAAAVSWQLPAKPNAKPPESFRKNFTFTAPAGWMEVTTNDLKIPLKLQLHSTAESRADGLIQVDAGPPLDGTLAASAKRMAGLMHGTVSPDAVTVDGVQGIKLLVPGEPGCGDSIVLTVFKDDLAYMLIGGGMRGNNITNDFDAFVASFHFVAAPAKPAEAKVNPPAAPAQPPATPQAHADPTADPTKAAPADGRTREQRLADARAKMEAHRAERAAKDAANPKDLPAGMAESAMLGGTTGGGLFIKLDPDHRPLLGIRLQVIDWGDNKRFRTFEPLYEPTTDKKPDETIVMAKDGYAIGAMSVNATDSVHAVCITFMKKTGTALDPKTAYTSPWYGKPATTDRKVLTGKGQYVYGLFGRKGMNMDAMGLVIDAAGAPATQP